MSSNYPASLDSATELPSPAAGAVIPAAADTNRSLALIAVETKLGINDSAASTGSAKDVLANDGSGGSDWRPLVEADISDLAHTTARTDEEIQDVSGGMFTGNTETGITATYQDADGTVDLVVDAPEGTAVLSTGEAGGSKFLREDGDGTSSWQALGGGGDALVANPLSQFAATTSAQFAGVISDETGTGSVVLATSPTLVTPALGTPSALVATNATGTAAGLTVGATTGVEAGADVTDATNVGAALTLTGDVTSSGSMATTIAAGAVDVAMLANGTDGELITWDAAGAPTVVAAGTADHVLTSNGAGAAPTFQAAAGGGGGGSPYGSTYEISSTGDYATLTAWQAGSPANNDILYLAEDITEAGAVTITQTGVQIFGKGQDIVLSMGTSALTHSGANGKWSNFTINRTSSGKSYFNSDEGTLQDMKFTSASTGLAVQLGGDDAFYSNVRSDDTSTSTRASEHMNIGGARCNYQNFNITASLNASSEANAILKGVAVLRSNLSNIFVSHNGTKSGTTAFCIYLHSSCGDSTWSNITAICDTSIAKGIFCDSVNTSWSSVFVYRGAVGMEIDTTRVSVNGLSHNGHNVTTCLEINGDDNTITGVNSDNNGGGDGIKLTGSNNVITGNRLSDYDDGIHIVSGTTNVVIGNNFEGSTTNNINDNGTSTLLLAATDSDPLNI